MHRPFPPHPTHNMPEADQRPEAGQEQQEVVIVAISQHCGPSYRPTPEVHEA